MNMLFKTPARATPRLWNDEVNELFENFFRPGWASEEPAREGLVPRIDVKEREHEFTVLAEMPGVKRDGIEITVEDGVLTFSGEIADLVAAEGEQVLRRERIRGRYVRSLRLGKEIDEKGVRANYRDGILEITLPKSEQAKPRKISVEVN